MTLVLASASAIRRTMLKDAGIAVEAVPAAIDERLLKQRFDDPRTIAEELARAKALDVSARRPDDWIIGSDSVVSVGKRLFDKPASLEEAADHLRSFSGKAMQLASAVALARGGRVDWSTCDMAELTVRPLSGEFIDSYLDREWPAVGHCVGVFRMEGPGIQLFSDVRGSHFTILGMPLIPLLNTLRDRGILPS